VNATAVRSAQWTMISSVNEIEDGRMAEERHFPGNVAVWLREAVAQRLDRWHEEPRLVS
jgi:hypothetical protein